ncbi:hypothetical protein [Massilicoli timonensis]|uniref:hypothetical protein n=1 Tax=Massilicoli timonensis TaxID=2015901 RepID=UPI003AABFA60
MSYQDRIDKKKTIKIMRKEMADFSDLYQLYQDDYTVKGFSYDSVVRIASYLSDPIISKIQHHDEKREQITKIIQAMSKLKADEVQVLYMKYILRYSDYEIQNTLNISEWGKREIEKRGLISMAIILDLCEYLPGK